jgi:hypothetical protein
LDVGLVGALVLYGQPLAASTAAVLLYHGILLWAPGLLGSFAFVQLHRTLQRQEQPAVVCMPLAETIETGLARIPAGAGAQRG